MSLNRLFADQPQPEIAGLIDVAHFLERREQAVRRRRWQQDPMGEIGQGETRLRIGERFEDGKAAGQALDLPRRARGSGRCSTAIRRRRVAVRHSGVTNRKSGIRITHCRHLDRREQWRA